MTYLEEYIWTWVNESSGPLFAGNPIRDRIMIYIPGQSDVIDADVE